ncbi:uncharacterized protein SPAPADRAFT_64885 [Spathaspora passalidarum NRRL Y-27907]|uniref:LicD/FKTN/FKRP nucleotidyltransferase domain-containing protein n=1 Tax=Spathaspora passalidarum (strain NRRL Y-27907 / 11-Y1) TaxID=619300 RepID=G3AEX7_SPAPN|nr:uncharacterized protein SPAPADRAFT_64885 [Spathaspora passalidarum NRRL Y-27907]EGW35807.1 hypothetical protein SPAPADRAFT_64885 [Spathaspora passalidarum NRRL Y-27907]
MLNSSYERKLLRIIPIILSINTIGTWLYYRFNQSSSSTIFFKDISSLPQVSFTNSNINRKLKSLHSKFKSPTFTSEITIPTTYFETSYLIHDPRVTISLTLNLLYHQIENNPENVSFPFNWADWVDLTYLNHQISKPENKRIKCSDLVEHMAFKNTRDKLKAKEDSMLFGCKNSYDLTKREIQEMGFTDLDKMPGFFQFQHSPRHTNEFIRVLQGKTYLLGRMPLPFQVIFLNDHGKDLKFTVDSKMNGRQIMEKYISNNNLKHKKKLTLDPAKEFDKLRVLLKSDTLKKVYKTRKIVRMNRSWFHYEPDDVNKEFKKLESKQQLTPVERGYLNSIIASRKTSNSKNRREPMYFKGANLIRGKANKDDGNHYEWRFFNGKWRDRYRHSLLLERILRNWFKFCQKYGIISWINYGSLLGWYRNGAIYPFDLDLDMQMSMYHMTILGKKFNQTLVVEDLHEGTGKYLIDVGTFIHNRYKIGVFLNHIDARFIDVDSGLYIDLTALASTKKYSDVHPKFFKDICDDPVEGPVLEDDGEIEVYNDRNDWVHKYNNISPLRLSMLEGVPVYIPKQIVKRMKFQYPCGTLNNFEFRDWYYVEQAGTWIHEKELLAVLDKSKAIQNGSVDKSNIKNQIKNLTDEQLYKLLSNDEATLSNYELARRNFGFHAKEIQYLFNIDAKLNRNKNDPPEGKVLDASPEGNHEYLRLIVDNVLLKAPHRDSICEYDRVKGKFADFHTIASRELDKIDVSDQE